MKPSIRCLPLNFLVLSLLLHHLMVPAASCPQGCYCLRDLLDCQNPTFPMTLPPRFIKTVSIRGKIPTIPENAFVLPEGSTLNSLSINQIQISKIESSAFNNLTVDSISFYNAKIKHLEPRIFSNSTSTSVSIYNSAFDVMPTSLFEGLTTESLNIYNNNITTLETGVFKSAKLHKTAAFYHNRISTVQKNAFKTRFPINIYLNKIQRFLIQDSIVPNSFHSNTFQCSCSLVWMWEDDSPLKYFLGRNKCLGPKQKLVVLENVDKDVLCKQVDLTPTSGIWKQSTTKTNTRKIETARPTAKGTTRLENFTERPVETAAADRSCTGKFAMNLVIIVTVTVVTCLFILF